MKPFPAKTGIKFTTMIQGVPPSFSRNIQGSDGGRAFTQTLSGTRLTASFTVDWSPDWKVTVLAHNAAGWSPPSATFTLGGL